MLAQAPSPQGKCHPYDGGGGSDDGVAATALTVAIFLHFPRR